MLAHQLLTKKLQAYLDLDSELDDLLHEDLNELVNMNIGFVMVAQVSDETFALR